MSGMPERPQLDIVRFETQAADAAGLLRALANPRRLSVLCRLVGGERSVSELQPLVGLSQSALSQHLALLRAAGVVVARREGRHIRYRIGDPAVFDLIAALAARFHPTVED